MYQFVSSFEQPKEVNYSFFYQICYYPDERTKKYHMRKYVLDDDVNIVQIKNYYLTKNQVKKFYKVKNPHEYKQYSTTSLANITRPQMGELVASKSDMLNNNQVGPMAFDSCDNYSYI